MTGRIKAIGLLSGGLDSALACAILVRQRIQVETVFFDTGFCVIGHHLTVSKRRNRPLQPPVYRVAGELGIPLSIIDISKDFREILLNPKYGYGKGMNPCKDCRIFMLQKAKTLMESSGAHFIFTGEVLGQRPMSQLSHSMRLIENVSGLSRLLLRPLSAKLLPITVPEEMGWVDRDKLYDINGRTRKIQLQLADEFGVTVYSQPAGGCCFLPDKQFTIRMRDMLEHGEGKIIKQVDYDLLKVGRHFRLSHNLKIVVGRNDEENNFLETFYARDYLSMQVINQKGPLTIVLGTPTKEQLSIIARITAAYSNGTNGEVKEILTSENGVENRLKAKPLDRDIIYKWMVK